MTHVWMLRTQKHIIQIIEVYNSEKNSHFFFQFEILKNLKTGISMYRGNWEKRVIFLKLWSLFCFGSIWPIPTIMIIWTLHHLPDFSMMSRICDVLRIYLKIAEAILEKDISSLTDNPSIGQRKLFSLLWDPRTQCSQVLNKYPNSTTIFHTSFPPSFCWDIVSSLSVVPRIGCMSPRGETLKASVF